MVKSGLELNFEIHRAPSELLLPSAKISSQNGQIDLAAYLAGISEGAW